MMCTHHYGTDNGGHCVALLVCCMICCVHNTLLLTISTYLNINTLVANWDILSSKAMIFQTFLWTNLILALASSMLCVYWMPSAAGSGIPEVKVYLNGVRSMQRLANWSMCWLLRYWLLYLVLVVYWLSVKVSRIELNCAYVMVLQLH